MDYYRMSIIKARILEYFFLALALVISGFIAYLIDLRINSFLTLFVFIGLTYLTSRHAMNYGMALYLKKKIKTAPNPRKMYWKFKIKTDNFTLHYPPIPGYTYINNEIPNDLKVLNKKNKTIMHFQVDRIVFRNILGKLENFKYSEITDLEIYTELYYSRGFKSLTRLEIKLKNNKFSEYNKVNLTELNTDIDEFEHILEHFKKKITSPL